MRPLTGHEKYLGATAVAFALMGWAEPASVYPFWLFLPAMVANLAPGVARLWWPAWNIPINEAALGANKTVRGAVATTTVGCLTGAAQWLMVDLSAFVHGIDLWQPDFITTAIHGLIMGFAVVLGGWVNSFVKRRKGLAPGAHWSYDYLDFLLAAYVVICLRLSFEDPSIRPVLPSYTLFYYVVLLVIPMAFYLIIYPLTNRAAHARGWRTLPH